ncbi:MAG TPA: YbaK/EbsC family protein [Anaerolinea sp.]|nr:YbaK/EbsC family protein [Anaerolinea sp.]
MHPQALRVQQFLAEAGSSAQVGEIPDSTRTALEAAAAVGCEVGQIVKSLVFVLDPPGEIILLLVSGANRVQEHNVGRLLGGSLGKANADQVQSATGYAIGGVPPIGHARPLPTYIDEDLLKYPQVWAAAGTPHAVFPISPEELVRITGGKPIQVT